MEIVLNTFFALGAIGLVPFVLIAILIDATMSIVNILPGASYFLFEGIEGFGKYFFGDKRWGYSIFGSIILVLEILLMVFFIRKLQKKHHQKK